MDHLTFLLQNHLFSYFAEFKARTKKDIEFWEQPNRSADGYMLLFQQQLQRHIIGPVAYPSLADTETKVRTNFLPHTRVLQCTNKNIQGDFWTASVHYWNKKMLSSQPELLFHEILHQKEPLVDSLAFIILALNKGEGGGGSIKMKISIWMNLKKLPLRASVMVETNKVFSSSFFILSLLTISKYTSNIF